jgi:hypothetical protein
MLGIPNEVMDDTNSGSYWSQVSGLPENEKSGVSNAVPIT